jgi:[ribosomal protein S18]-alanine N-acetyltransferase
VIEIGAGTARDAAVLDRLIEDAFDPRYGEGWTRSQCLGVLALPGVWLLIARVDGEAAGFALSRAIADEAELLLLATAAECRRQGIGAALLRAAIGEARARGVGALHLEVRAGNEAVNLYRSAGFVKVGERRGYYRGKTGQIFDAHTYRLSLA